MNAGSSSAGSPEKPRGTARPGASYDRPGKAAVVSRPRSAARRRASRHAPCTPRHRAARDAAEKLHEEVDERKEWIMRTTLKMIPVALALVFAAASAWATDTCF